jgi:hypothetical protein
MIPREILKKIRQSEIRTNRIAFLQLLCPLAVISCLLLLCSCATTNKLTAIVPATELPADVNINKGAGRGGHLTVTLRLDSGEELPFGVDTGCPITFLPKSLESKMGKRLGTKIFDNFGTKHRQSIYAAPKLYLGNILLKTGSRVAISDDSMGILGMDCLCHYCIQLDFQAGKMRFLDTKHIQTEELGKAFPLENSSNLYIQHGGLFEGKNPELFIDTGFPLDAMLKPALFRQALLEQPPQPVPLLEKGVIKGTVPGLASFPKCIWDGNTYTNLAVEKGQLTIIGLRFLARHLVTFDFPNRTMYLKQTSIGPL